jgi:cyclophilin family peptidyl-prolyl cis-trans isomerase
MSNKRTREKQLQKLAAQRRAVRKRHSRQRGSAIALVVVVALVAGVFLVSQIFFKKSPAPAKAASTSKCSTTAPPTAGEKKKLYKKPEHVIKPGKTYTAVLDTSCGTFDIQLDQKLAPNTVNSIVFLALHHFYDGLTFHRIARDFVIQGGDPKGNGTGGPGYETHDVPPKTATYPIGTVAMAKGGTEPAGTAGSQFFVVTSSSANQSLAPAGKGPQYAIIGHVVSGMEAVNAIAALKIAGTNPTDGPPAQKVYINTMTIKES